MKSKSIFADNMNIGLKQISIEMIRRYLVPLAATTGCVALCLGAWAFSVPVNDWAIAGPFGGSATTIAVDPGNSESLLVGARNSLLFRSEDRGTNWELLNFPKRNLGEVTSVIVDPADSKHYLAGMIAAEGAGLFESTDLGKSWSAVKDIRDVGVRALGVSASQPSRFVAGTLRGVMLSDDSGKSWSRISDPENLEMTGITAVAIDPKDPNIIYAGTPHLPWKTTDGGKTWQSIHTGMIDDSDVFSIYVDPASPSDIFASACSGIYSSNNRGDLWHKLLGIPNTSRRTHVIREDPSRSGTIFAGTTTGLFKSGNRGGSWKTLTSTQVNSMAFDPSKPGGVYLAMEYEGVGRSSDGGETVQLADKGFVDRQISAVTAAGDKLFAIESQDIDGTGLFKSSDHGASWVKITTPRTLAGVHLKAITGLPSDERTLLAATSHEMFKSVDGGTIWKLLPIRLVIPPPAEPEKKAAQSIPSHGSRAAVSHAAPTRARVTRAVKPRVQMKEIATSEVSGLYSVKSGTKTVLFAATDLGLLRSEDTGEHWMTAAIPGSTAVTALYAAPKADGHLIARAAGGVYESKDYGDRWSELYFPLPTSDINSIAIPADAGAPLLVATRVGLYLSHDGGTKWFANPSGIPASTVNSVTYTGSDSTAYAVQYGRLYQTKDGGTSWSVVPSAISSLRIRQLWIPENGSGRLYGVTGDLGILYRQ